MILDKEPLFDLVDNLEVSEIKCLDYGFVKLIDMMPRMVPSKTKTADAAIVQAARVSYGDGTKTPTEDRGLIRYLMRNSHSTPFEMVEFKFTMKIPIFCARQIIRHRTANVNEISGRYSILKDEFYIPDVENVRKQSAVNKQCSDGSTDNLTAEDFVKYIEELTVNSYEKYIQYMEKGVSREQARMCLPVNLYTEFYWKIDLHNLFHFLALRCDAHCQEETRVVAQAMLDLITPLVPMAIEAWNDYHPYREAVKLSRLEIECLQKALKGIKAGKIETSNSREQNEWIQKAKKLGLVIDE